MPDGGGGMGSKHAPAIKAAEAADAPRNHHQTVEAWASSKLRRSRQPTHRETTGPPPDGRGMGSKQAPAIKAAEALRNHRAARGRHQTVEAGAATRGRG